MVLFVLILVKNMSYCQNLSARVESDLPVHLYAVADIYISGLTCMCVCTYVHK